jgi:cobalt-precorrin 5A hydrolase
MERDVMIVAGFGFRASAGLDALRAAFDIARTGQPHVTMLAAPADKIALVDRLGAALGLPVMPVAAEALIAVDTVTLSPASLRYRQTGSVAEAAALAAAGPGARLLATRHLSPDRMATCAIAQGFAP